MDNKRITESTNSELGDYIKTLRQISGLTQTGLAKKIGSSVATICMVETGTMECPTDKLLKRLAKGLSCPLEDLVARRPKRSTEIPETDLGKIIHQKREALNMTIGVFAKKMRVTLATARRLETKATRLKYPTAIRLSKVLEVDLESLADFVGAERVDVSSENKLGEIIRRSRKKLALNTTDLAKRLGVTRQFVEQIEHGDSTCNRAKLSLLSKILKVDLSEFESVVPKNRKLKRRFGDNALLNFLIKTRLSSDLTIAEASKKIGCAETRLGMIECGKYKPSNNFLKKFSVAFECEIPEP